MNGITSQNNNSNYFDLKRDKKSLNESNMNKTKNNFLTFGLSSNNSPIKKRNVFQKSIVIKKKSSIIDDIHKETNNYKHPLEFNFFYYYCLSRLNKSRKIQENIKLFNFAISFYKQKLDIIYLFHIILYFEKIIEQNRKQFTAEDETFFRLDD